MARGKRWIVQFESLHGVACRVDIYDEGWTGSVTTLLGADNPFYYQEENDEDMLLTIRYRTGYLRLVCRDTDDFSELYPAQNTDRYIEFYYGSTLDFNGYIQAQDFGTEYAAPPYVVELPVISPLGLAAGTYFDANDFNPPRWMLWKDIVKASFDLLSANYDGFIFPQYIPGNSPAKITALYLNSLTFCPFGDNFDKSSSTQTIKEVYEPKSVKDALDMICTGFGCILHDAPGHPVFQRIDYTGNYVSFSLTQGGYENVITPQVTALPDCATMAGDDGKTTTVMPVSDIKVDYDGDEIDSVMNFDFCRAYDRTGTAYPGWLLVTNMPFSGINEFVFSGSRPDVNISLNQDGIIAKNTIALAAYGQDSLAEAIMFRPAENSAWGNNYLLAKLTFYIYNGEDFRIKFSHHYGESIDQMNNPSYGFFGYASLMVKLTSGGSTLESKTFSSGEDQCVISHGGNAVPYPLTVEFYVTSIDRWMHVITDVRLERYETAVRRYIYANQDVYRNEYHIRGGMGNEYAEITRGTSIYCRTVNRMIPGNIIDGYDQGYITDLEPKYPYMIVAQELLTIPLTLNSHISPANIYCDKYTEWSDDTTQRRIIARSFEPWNDKTTLMLHSY